LTGIWGEANCGGWFADGLKKSGYDALIVEGASETPVYIWMNDGDVEIKDAKHLWGKWTAETQSLIKKEVGFENAAIVTIGPAAEKLVKISAVIHMHRAAGRTGLGAVMASKKLKAVAARGTKKIRVAEPDKITELRRKIAAETFQNWMTKLLRNHGQSGFVPFHQEWGNLPTRNFRSGTFEGADKISGQTMSDTILVKKNACPRCPVTCKRMVEVKEGPFAPVLPEYGGPEYESTAALGSLLGIDNLEAIAKMNMLCNAYGIDTISAGACIAFAMDCYENGILSKKDTNGLELTFGNTEAAVKMVEKIALREGFGDTLAEGVKRAVQRIGKGSDRFALEIKGLEVPMHDPRKKKGIGLMFAVSNRGACHMQSMHDEDLMLANVSPEIGIKTPLDPFDTSREKVLAMKKTQDWVAMLNSLALCLNIYWFGGGVYYRPLNIIEILNAVTGWGYTVEEFMTTGERINTLCRAFNVREGITRENDRLPPKFMELVTDGLTDGQFITKEEFNSMLDNYYEICSWDIATGIPTKEKLKEMDLGFVNLP
jgi:aldehyde:ferredoxin oxidoreductase